MPRADSDSDSDSLIAQKLTTPEELRVYSDEDSGVWRLNVEWKDGFPNSITPEKVTYDIQIFYTEQQKLVHHEMIELKADPMGHYKWSWISPLPLQCTSHSVVQLRYRDGDHTSAWTPSTTLPGEDLRDVEEVRVYPQNHVALVNESIRFCCILKSEHEKNFSSTDFVIRISNRTYVTKPFRYPDPSPAAGFDILCDNEGSTYYIGYPPDVHSMTCETRDLSSVECHWIESTTVPKTNTNFNINGRKCNQQHCVLNNYIDTGVVNWTLTANNKFGTTIISDLADPRHRVHLKAPTLLTATLITARNASLNWRWSRMLNHSSFPMICQVEVNDSIIKERFEGADLTSLVLTDLKPFTNYSVRLRCGSGEHFYKWGDWSDLISFTTKEDIPDSVDVWMEVSDNQTYVVWKNESESNGKIIEYQLVFGSVTRPNAERIIKPPVERCHKLQADRAKTHPLISVSARNSVGLSPPSNITIPNLAPAGGGVKTSVINGNNKTFYMVWDPSPRSECGYVVDWYPTYKSHQCAVKWKKKSSDHFNATIDSDLKEGVKYTLSVFGCTSGALSLLQRKEGYAVELPPSGKVQNLQAKQEGLNVYLNWENVSEQEQKGFIQGYNVSYRGADGNEGNVVISEPGTHMATFSLPVETYTFTVKAFTSAGDGPGAEITLKMNHQSDLAIINMVAGLMVLGFVLCIVAVYRHWKWLKSTLWPEIPKPRLSAEFLKKSVHQWQVIDGLLKEEAVLKVNCPEICSALTEEEPLKDHQEDQDYNCPRPKDSSHFEEYQTPKINPPAFCLIDVDFSYQEFPCPGILNPTYDQLLVCATENRKISNYRPQTHTGSIDQQPSNTSAT
ncbi:Leukemia inhibitory factor receptor [Bagarius yarrelli]|uniref:Leukemia inhibitory factor receptor n=1 Tax=Bagarius yarrelli TaxID=175774 RepID=A0A556VCF1_BAGYA|nr:Leukemia inhibitory factor receptor [Bagarius yarrelli]